jgi:hypothetical protein
MSCLMQHNLSDAMHPVWQDLSLSPGEEALPRAFSLKPSALIRPARTQLTEVIF